MKKIALLIIILLSVVIGQVYARASNFRFTLHNSSVYLVSVTEVCKHNVLDPCGTIVILNPGETKEVVARQHHHNIGMEIDWEIAKSAIKTRYILCESSVNWHLKFDRSIAYWTFFGEKKRLSDAFKACDAKKITGTAVVGKGSDDGIIYFRPSYYCGKIDGHRWYKFSINIG